MLLVFANADDFFEDESFEDEFAEPVAQQINPLDDYNRLMTRFNDVTYELVFDPVAKKYKKAMPFEVRDSLYNFFDNLQAPKRFLNNLLQGKFKNSASELFRFAVNSTLGVGGFGDAGEKLFGISKHEEDFGQTLGFYGVKPGYHIVLPLLGPSNVRDSFGFVADYFSSPINYIDSYPISIGINGYSRLNQASFHEGEYAQIKKNAIDLYPYLRDLYEQNRENEIKK